MIIAKRRGSRGIVQPEHELGRKNPLPQSGCRCKACERVRAAVLPDHAGARGIDFTPSFRGPRFCSDVDLEHQFEHISCDEGIEIWRCLDCSYSVKIT